MGRWAQARRRGTSVPLLFTLPAPVPEEDFALFTGGGAVNATRAFAFPAGADGFKFEVHFVTLGTTSFENWTGDPTQLAAEQADGDQIDVRAAFTLAGVQVSPYGDFDTIFVVV